MDFKVLDAGFLSTIQDNGRYGYQKYGVSPSGVMDGFAARVANSLVKNTEDAALIETNFKGISLEFFKEAKVAVTGGECEVRINNKKIKLWGSHTVKPGDVLEMGYCTSGLRNYISFHGGIDVPLVMGSRSTNLRAKIGGIEGRKLKNGDGISLLKDSYTDMKNRELKKEDIPEYPLEIEVGVILGQQRELFKEDELENLFKDRYEVSRESDRMGIRLLGNKIEHSDGADIISDGITFGAIQVPGDGQPIIMMADRQTTGGYTKVGNVITADLSKLGQAVSGNLIKFIPVKYEDAVEKYRAEEEFFKSISRRLTYFDMKKKYNITVNGKFYEVEVDEIISV